MESDAAWIDKCKVEPSISAAIKAGRLTLLHADIGPIGRFGFPADNKSAWQWPRYYLDVWTAVSAPELDVILVDGRFRVACALQSLLRAGPDCKVIVHDFADRAYYHVVLEFSDIVEQVDRLCVLRRKQQADFRSLALKLSGHILDPR